MKGTVNFITISTYSHQIKIQKRKKNVQAQQSSSLICFDYYWVLVNTHNLFDGVNKIGLLMSFKD